MTSATYSGYVRQGIPLVDYLASLRVCTTGNSPGRLIGCSATSLSSRKMAEEAGTVRLDLDEAFGSHLLMKSP